MTLRGYSIRLSSSDGAPIDYNLAARALSLSYGRTVNDVGSLSLVLPGTYRLPESALPDGRLEVWRRLPNGREYLDTDTIWLIQAAEYRESESGERTLLIEADTPLTLAAARFVFAYAGTSGAEKSGAADDVLKAVVREQLGASAGVAASASRSVPALSVAADVSQAPTISKAFAWRRVLDVLQDIAATAAQDGTYLAFDIVSPTPDTMRFETFTLARGTDRRFPAGLSPVILSPETRTLIAPSIRYDFRDEVTYALAAGSGEGSARVLADAIDLARVGASPYRYRERFVDGRNTASGANLADEAGAVVRQGRPRVIISGRIAQVDSLQYGVHWTWGDYVTIQAFGRQVDARIDALTVEVSSQGETIGAVVRGETYV